MGGELYMFFPKQIFVLAPSQKQTYFLVGVFFSLKRRINKTDIFVTFVQNFFSLTVFKITAQTIFSS